MMVATGPQRIAEKLSDSLFNDPLPVNNRVATAPQNPVSNSILLRPRPLLENGVDVWPLYRDILFCVGAKQEAMEDADVTKLEAVFPPEIMAGDGSVVGYGEIFPKRPVRRILHAWLLLHSSP